MSKTMYFSDVEQSIQWQSNVSRIAALLHKILYHFPMTEAEKQEYRTLKMINEKLEKSVNK